MSKILYDLQGGVPGVRLALPKDEADLFWLLKMLHRENGMFGLNEDKLVKGIQYATQGEGGIIFCIDEDGHVRATLGMTITCDWYSDDAYLLERWNYVHPDYRRSDYARKLVEQSKWASAWFTERARRKGDPPVPLQVGINSFDRTEAKVRLYARHMPCIGAYFLYGEPPIQAEKYQREARRIEEMARSVRGQPDPQRRRVVPVVETIIQLSQRERQDVQ